MTTCSELYNKAGTRQYMEMLATRQGLRAVARWIMEEDLLHQFLLAKEHAAWAENGRGVKEESTTEGGAKCKAE